MGKEGSVDSVLKFKTLIIVLQIIFAKKKKFKRKEKIYVYYKAFDDMQNLHEIKAFFICMYYIA
jgi:hypothetical protein